MDRRQRKSREAIFNSFTELISSKDFNQITVGEIIDAADVGRATFYSHFETKEYLLKEYCEELFCHLFDIATGENHEHRHIFDCDDSDSVVLHLFKHLQKNDNNILVLLSSQNNALFLSYFRMNLEQLVDRNPALLNASKAEMLPVSFWRNHVVSTLVEAIRWWIINGLKEKPEELMRYFLVLI